METKRPCSSRYDSFCPVDGQYQYNTEVVFDMNGCLVARYHKQNLVKGEEQKMFDVTKDIEHSYFDTDFGRFGLIICYDAFFKSPAIELVERYNVTDIIFSTAWTNVNLHYTSVAYHSGWARMMNVNFLSANINYRPARLTGSGVYCPNGIINYTFEADSSAGKLLVTQVPVRRNLDKYCSTSPKTPVQFITPSITDNSTIFSDWKNKITLFDMFKLKYLNGLSGTISACMKNVCCEAKFNRSVTEEDYALGVFDGMHRYTGTYYLEICILVRCIAGRCGGQVRPIISNTVFHYYELTATMPTKYVIPEVITPDVSFPTDWNYYNGRQKRIQGTNKKLFLVALMGRNFDKDPFSGGRIVHDSVELDTSGKDFITPSIIILFYTLLISVI